jgi:elongation factor P
MITASQIRAGMALRVEGQVYKVLQVDVKAGAGQQGGTVKTQMRNVESGRLWEPHFRPDLRMEDLEIERQNMEFLYATGGEYVFMNPDTFDQVEIPAAVLGEGMRFLKEGVRIPVEFFDGKPISVAFPEFVDLRVADTAAPAHGQQDSTWKEATLDNGVQIMVPLFIATGEMVRINVQTGRYLERVREKRKTA